MKRLIRLCGKLIVILLQYALVIGLGIATYAVKEYFFAWHEPKATVEQCHTTREYWYNASRDYAATSMVENLWEVYINEFGRLSEKLKNYAEENDCRSRTTLEEIEQVQKFFNDLYWKESSQQAGKIAQSAYEQAVISCCKQSRLFTQCPEDFPKKWNMNHIRANEPLQKNFEQQTQTAASAIIDYWAGMLMSCPPAKEKMSETLFKALDKRFISDEKQP